LNPPPPEHQAPVPQSVAVLGTGTMGGPMAGRLAQAGFDVRVWNRSREKAEAVAGASVADVPVEAVAGADVVMTMLADADAVEEVMEEDGALGGMDAEAVWLQTSTVGVAAAERFAELARERGVVYVDSPVHGTRKPAEEGELVALASGPGDARHRVEPVLRAFCREVRWVGEAGAGTRLKMVTGLWVLALTEATAEAIALARGLELDPRELLDAIEGSQSDSPYLHLKAEAILSGELEPSFTLELAEKDALLVHDAARLAGLDVALADFLRRRFLRAIELGHGDEDLAATYFAAVDDS